MNFSQVALLINWEEKKKLKIFRGESYKVSESLTSILILCYRLFPKIVDTVLRINK